MADSSNGYDRASAEYLATRRRSNVGLETVRAWAGALPPGASVLDVGCGDGEPVSRALVAAGLSVYGVDASPSMAAAFRANFPHARVVCEPAERSALFAHTFAGAVAWGLLFLLPAEAQRAVIRNVAAALEPGGRFLFTAPEQVCTWDDLLTGLPSVSLGSATYRVICREAGLVPVAEYTDEGDNHYYDVARR
ncbi:class I SAM-dependent methyltransferase [Frigoriglobus tundricola]|uniref:Methyltransferase domain-containing protein n=1 Tax=Frigoriglobus tundricola TaxID=2774151 RepID=A0A6M5YKH6_9BACT|nr:class I SAM-dependent methyltransferase [Frigoriglobus tundricola]QJW93786.1 hypothetical protein FTUN_1297 [Frigoriglobus tundricola]